MLKSSSNASKEADVDPAIHKNVMIRKEQIFIVVGVVVVVVVVAVVALAVNVRCGILCWKRTRRSS